jgi:hypothetical protein
MKSNLIVVAPDEVVAAARAAEQDGEKASDLSKVTSAVGRYFRYGPAILLMDGAQALAAWVKARQNGVNVTQISSTEANGLIFPPGHPRDGVLYVAHPATDEIYFTVASFHRLAFEHKFSEAIDLLMHLGATEIKVKHVQGWSREFAAKMAGPLAGAEANVQASANGANTSSLLYEAQLKGNTEPSLPDSLVWYQHEPTWQSIAKGRMKFGLKEFSLAVNYEDDFGINAGLKLNAGKSGLDLGGTFEDHQATTWQIQGKFAV